MVVTQSGVTKDILMAHKHFIKNSSFAVKVFFYVYDYLPSMKRRCSLCYGVFQIVVTHNTVNGKPRGYAFIEYEHERDMHCE